MARAHVGIINQGNTCYLNSVIQALYYIPVFRTSIFNLPDGDRDPITRALRIIFAQLEARVENITTTELTSAFGWSAQDAALQHDVHELVQQLFDRLEVIAKGTPNESFIRDLFYGTTVYRSVTTDGTNYVSDRLEGYYDVELVVKGKNNIMESLNVLAEGEKIEGVMLELTPGGKPSQHTIMRSQHFVELPPVLLIHPNRVDFDKETFESITLSNRWEFTAELDLANYMTDRNTLKLDKESVEKRASLCPTPHPLRDAISTTYELRSILIHAGDTEVGHYYIFVLLDGQWVRFNDEVVDNVDAADVERSAYGGSPVGWNYRRFGSERASLLVYINKSCAAEVLKETPVMPEVLEAARNIQKQRDAQCNSCTYRFFVCDGDIADILDDVPTAAENGVHSIVLPEGSGINAIHACMAKSIGADVERLRVWDFGGFQGNRTEVLTHSIPTRRSSLLAQVLKAPKSTSSSPFIAFLRTYGEAKSMRNVTVLESREELSSAIPKGWDLYRCSVHPVTVSPVSPEKVSNGDSLVMCSPTVPAIHIEKFLVERQYIPTQVVHMDRMDYSKRTHQYVITVANNTTYRSLQNTVYALLKKDKCPECPVSADYIAFHASTRASRQPNCDVWPRTLRSMDGMVDVKLEQLVGHYEQRCLYYSILPLPFPDVAVGYTVSLNVGWGMRPGIYVTFGQAEQITLQQLAMEAHKQVGSFLPPEIRETLARTSPTDVPFRLLKVRYSQIVDVITDYQEPVMLRGSSRFVMDLFAPKLPGYDLIDVYFCSRRSKEEFFGTPTNIGVSQAMTETGRDIMIRVAKKLFINDAENCVKKWILYVRGGPMHTTRTVGAVDELAKLVVEAGGRPFCLLIDRPRTLELDSETEVMASGNREQAIVLRTTSGSDMDN